MTNEIPIEDTAPRLVTLSAHDLTVLRSNITRIGNVVKEHALADLAFTCARKSQLRERSYKILGCQNDNFTDGFIFGKANAPPSLSMVFTGQGAQWATMGADLMKFKVFRRSIARLQHILKLFDEDLDLAGMFAFQL
jgi:acyl transferase domain-containing protein